MTSITERTIRANGVLYPLLTDSGVYQSGEGYERLLIINDWHPTRHRLMARIRIRVDRNPGASYANTCVYEPEKGWQTVAMLDHREFWDDMPGYLRWANDNSDTKTAALASSMIADLVTLVESGEVDI